VLKARTAATLADMLTELVGDGEFTLEGDASAFYNPNTGDSTWFALIAVEKEEVEASVNARVLAEEHEVSLRDVYGSLETPRKLSVADVRNYIDRRRTIEVVDLREVQDAD